MGFWRCARGWKSVGVEATGGGGGGCSGGQAATDDEDDGRKEAGRCSREGGDSKNHETSKPSASHHYESVELSHLDETVAVICIGLTRPDENSETSSLSAGDIRSTMLDEVMKDIGRA